MRETGFDYPTVHQVYSGQAKQGARTCLLSDDQPGSIPGTGAILPANATVV